MSNETEFTTGDEKTWAVTSESGSVLVFDCVLTEARGPRAFDVVIIKAGQSLNRIDGRPILYTPDVLQSYGHVFEGAEVRAIRLGQSIENMDFDHARATAKEILASNIIGALEGVHFRDGELRARLVLHEGAGFMADLLKFSVERAAQGAKPLIGLSIDAMGSFSFRTHEGTEVAEVTELRGPASVDVVSSPAAGGEIVRLAASMRKEHEMPDEKKTPPDGGTPTPAAGKVEESAKVLDFEAEKKRLLAESDAELKRQRERFAAELKEAQDKAKCGLLLERKLAEARLPDDATELVREKFADAIFEESALDERIEKVRKLTVRSDPTGQVVVPGVKIIQESRDKAEAALMHMFMRNTFEPTRIQAEKELRESGAAPIYSLHKFVQEVFGIDLRDGIYGDTAKRRKLTESLTTSSWTDIFGDVMNKALLRSFANNNWTEWRKIVSVQPLRDFMTQHSIRMGGYANLSAVAQGANYPAMTSPGDEEHEWTPAKYGGTEDLTREMILADQVGSIARIPSALAYAAARTLYEFVFDLITIAGQPTMAYDSTSLFHANHSNLGTTALSATEAGVVWTAMNKYSDMSSSKRIGVQPKYVCVPVDLWKTAVDAFVTPTQEKAPGYSTDESFVKGMGIEPILVRHWTNTKDHVYVADPAVVPGFLMGFIGGREEPELFTQDNANFGSVFDRDAITYKIRHEYGGSPVDHRAFYAEDVA